MSDDLEFQALPNGDLRLILKHEVCKVKPLRGSDPIPSSYAVDWANAKMDRVKQLEAELDEALEANENKWQPGKTAPRDGTGFLAVPWTRAPEDIAWTWWIEEEQRWANWDWSCDPYLWFIPPEL